MSAEPARVEKFELAHLYEPLLEAAYLIARIDVALIAVDLDRWETRRARLSRIFETPRTPTAALLMVLAAVGLSACGQRTDPPPGPAVPEDTDMSIRRAQRAATLPGDPSAGEPIWALQCAACHREDASGSSAGPSLLEGDRAEDLEMAELILEGRGAMPSFRGLLTDQDIADVLAHIRLLQARHEEAISDL